ncbi:hypothetical protein [Actinoplanes subtropicus]|nr:hypothetical protein [Actinoplanes subtropicus]
MTRDGAAGTDVYVDAAGAVRRALEALALAATPGAAGKVMVTFD